jgi:hypothetical protein
VFFLDSYLYRTFCAPRITIPEARAALRGLLITHYCSPITHF